MEEMTSPGAYSVEIDQGNMLKKIWLGQDVQCMKLGVSDI